MKLPDNARELVGINQHLWFCLIDRNGFMLGNDKGVICYKTAEMAMAANTLAHARMGKYHGHFRIGIFTAQPLRHRGEHEFKLSTPDAFALLERRRN